MQNHIKVGTAILIINDKDQILLARRLSKHEHGKLGTPGGKVEFGEHPLDAILRETKEEIGVELDQNQVNYLGLISSEVYPDEDEHYMCIWFFAKVNGLGELKIEQDSSGNPKTGPWQWLNVDKVSDASLMRSIKIAFRRYKTNITRVFGLTHNPGEVTNNV